MGLLRMIFERKMIVTFPYRVPRSYHIQEATASPKKEARYANISQHCCEQKIRGKIGSGGGSRCEA